MMLSADCFSDEQVPIIFRETVSTDKSKGLLTPPTGAVRYQFLNLTIKAAARKYKINPKADINYTDAMRQWLDE